MNKNLRRFLIVIMILVVAVGMVSCGGKEEASESEKEVIRVGMELKWPAFESTDVNGNPEGISVMLAEAFGEYLGKDVEIVDLPFGSLIPALETEKIDVIIGSMSITELRKEKISFSDPYMYFKVLSAVHKDSVVKKYEDIFTQEGLKFVAPKAFASIDFARANAINPEILEFDDKATASLELANGNADIFMVDAASAVSLARQYPDDLFVIYEPVDVSPIGMGVRKDDVDLLKSANDFIGKRDELGVNDKIAKEYDSVLEEMVGKGLEFYLNEN